MDGYIGQTTQNKTVLEKTIFPREQGQVIEENLKCQTGLHHIFVTACGESSSSLSPLFELF